MPKVGRPKSEDPKVRVHITIDKELRDQADEFGRSEFFNEAARRFTKTKGFRAWGKQKNEDTQSAG